MCAIVRQQGGQRGKLLISLHNSPSSLATPPRYLLLARTHREACLQTAHGNAVTVQPSHSVNVLIHPRLGHRVLVDVVSRRNGLSALQEGIDDVPDLGLVAQRVPALERLELFC